MSEHVENFELLLRQALAPVDPPADLEERLEARLTFIVDAAADELESWELGAMRDPRNWARPLIATVAGSGAAVGLVLVRTQRKRHKRRAAASGALDLGRRTLRDLRDEAGRLFEDAARRR
jgi:hypothetical protein